MWYHSLPSCRQMLKKDMIVYLRISMCSYFIIEDISDLTMCSLNDSLYGFSLKSEMSSIIKKLHIVNNKLI